MNFRALSALSIPALLLFVLGASPQARAQEGRGAAAEGHGALVLATYEVGDLVVRVPDYFFDSDASLASIQQTSGRGYGGFAAGGGGGMGGGFGGGGRALMAAEANASAPGASTSGNPNQITVESLVNLIQEVVAPDTWAVSGGQARIQQLGSALVVSQTDQVHREIAKLLDQLRNGSATRRTVSIEARWLLLVSDELDQLLTPDKSDEEKVNRHFLDELTRRSTSLRGATRCFSGQAVYIISGTQRSFVSSYIPVVGSVEPPQPRVLYAVDPSAARGQATFTQFGGEGAAGANRSVGYQPIITTPNFGATLEVRPTLTVGGNDAVVDLRSTVTFPSTEQQAADVGAMMGVPPVDRVAIQLQKLATTLRMPLGEPILVGGMTYLTSTDGAAQVPPAGVEGQSSEQRQLYLIIELR